MVTSKTRYIYRKPFTTLYSILKIYRAERSLLNDLVVVVDKFAVMLHRHSFFAWAKTLWLPLVVLFCYFSLREASVHDLCSLVAGTDVQQKISSWSCTANGVVSTNPCLGEGWVGVTCASGNVSAIDWTDKDIAGQ